MKRIVTFVLLSCLGFVQAQISGAAQVVPSSSVDSYSTTFPLAEDPISEGGAWTGGEAAGSNLWGNFQTSSGIAYGVTMPTIYGDPTAIMTGTWNSTQSAQATVKINSTSGWASSHELEIRLRTTITNNSITGYEIYCSVVPGNPYCFIATWGGPNGVYANLVTGPSLYLQEGDILEATASGTNPTTITAYLTHNGARSQIMEAVDNGTVINGNGYGPWASGAPGIGAWSIQNDFSTFGFSSFTATGGYPGGQVADPTFSPAPGTHNSEISVSISDVTSGATICYTTDGTTPTAASGTCTAGTTYSVPISVPAQGMLIRAIASESGLNNSNVVVGTYIYSVSATMGGISAVTGQNTGGQSLGGIPAMLTFPESVTSGNQIIVATHCYSASTTPTINPPEKASGTAIVGAFTQDGAVNLKDSKSSRFFAAKIYRALVNGSGSLTLSFSATGCSGGIVMMDEFQGITAVDGAAVISNGTGSTESSGNVTTSAAGMVLMTSAENSTANFMYSQSDTNIFRDSLGALGFTGEAQYKITASAGTYTLTAETGENWAWWALSVAYR